MAVKKLDELYDLSTRILMAVGTSESQADAVANALVAADADGVASHGVSRLPGYADQVASGKIAGQAIPLLEKPAKAAVRVDAAHGFAYPAMELGLTHALELVRETGIVGVSIANSHHAGMAGRPVEAMASFGMVALGFVNSPAAIAPWGGTAALFGTNPIAFACPNGDNPPIVVDLALSKVARGKIKLAADAGKPIPDDWALDGEGQPTTDAGAAMSGSLLPMGDARGAALVLAVEILAATLTASNYGFEASSFFEAEGPPPGVGQFFIVMDPAAFAGSAEAFTARMAALMTAYMDQPGTRLPGARRHENRAKAEAEGVDIPDALIASLESRIA